MTQDTTDRIEALEEAREMLYTAIELIEMAVRRTPVASGAHAYIIPSLKMAASAEHEYLGSQPYNIDDLIRALEEGDAADEA